jgi:energy-coupling factor transporter ATP-binding protein EcfA2
MAMPLLGEIFIAQGLVTEDEVERALRAQRDEGGRFGDCLISLGIVTEEEINAVLGETPEAPRNLKEMDVDPMILLQLMVKGMYLESFETPSQLSDAMRLPNSVVNELLKEAVDRKLMEVIGSADSSVGAFSEMRYLLTALGRTWANESLEQSQYFGPAPVTLESYRDRVALQRVTNEWVTRQDIVEAFKELVIPERFVDRLGPSINSGSALLIYGPAGNGKTTIAEILGTVFRNVIYIPHCFEVDGQIIKVFDPSVHKPVSEAAAGTVPRLSIQRDHFDRRWVPCQRPLVIAGGELTLDMLDLQFSEVSRFYEAPLHVKALNGIFVIDDFGRQRAEPEDILNRWVMPLNNRVDYLKLHTGKAFQVPFDELIIFSTNMHPNDLMDPAFLRRITYKLETVEPSEELFREVFENVARNHDMELTEETYNQVLETIRGHGAPLAYYHPQFIVNQVLATCKFQGKPPEFNRDNVDDAMLNLFVNDPRPAANADVSRSMNLSGAMRKTA